MLHKEVGEGKHKKLAHVLGANTQHDDNVTWT